MKDLKSIQKIKINFHNDKAIIVAKFPTWEPNKDARVTVFSKCINVCNSTELSFKFIHSHLSNLEWWEKNVQKEILPTDQHGYIEDYDM
jgi:hypothetical protein